ncbi:PxKF domain-containing protein [Aquipuribacter sp. SD81]|uniref:PxKF domain-containing protein n=1 Tax=Aquipuribacter sp. SD81 TaxID=3127703 RepID=UPI003015CDB5
MRRPALATAVLAACTLLVAALAGPAAASPAPGSAPTGGSALRVGTWDTALRPWMTDRVPVVVDEVAGTDLDVLALQGVWSADGAAAITADPRVAARYPYSYYAPAGPTGFAFCSLDVPRSELEDFITGLILSGTDPRQALQPATGAVDPFISLLALGLVFRNQQPCVAAVLTALQTIPDDRSPYDAIDVAYYQGTQALAHGGSPGLLLLSARPIEDVETVHHDSYLEGSATVYATVAGTRLAAVGWPFNRWEDVDPSLAYLETGARQESLVPGLLAADVDIVLGRLNSGPGYQPAAYDALLAGGLVPLADGATRCPAATHAGYRLCVGDALLPQRDDVATDNVLVSPALAPLCAEATRFATDPVSDRVGLAATCGWSVDGFRSPVDMGGVLNRVKGGSSVPLKFAVETPSGPLTDVAALGATLTTTRVTCTSGAPTDDLEQTVTGRTALTYDPVEKQFVQVWATPKAPGTCHRVSLRTADGTVTSALFLLR